LPDVGVTCIRETCTVSSEDITPQSSLVRAHAPIPLSLLDFGLSLVGGVSAGCYQPLLLTGTFSTLFCESFLGCLVPCHGGPIGCSRLLLPRCHRPFPKRGELASRFFPRTRLFVGSFSRLQTFRYVQAPKFARLPDRSHRCSLAAGRPRLLHPGRTCFVASARTGYARRPNTGN
jgi:hypothetical protein